MHVFGGRNCHSFKEKSLIFFLHIFLILHMANIFKDIRACFSTFTFETSLCMLEKSTGISLNLKLVFYKRFRFVISWCKTFPFTRQFCQEVIYQKHINRYIERISRSKGQISQELHHKPPGIHIGRHIYTNRCINTHCSITPSSSRRV